MQTSQKNINLAKGLLDLVMAALLVLLYQKRTISMSFHELGGLCVFGLFLIHKALNWRWITAVTARLFDKNKGGRLRVLWVVDALLLAAMTVLLVTGLMITKTLPFRLGDFPGASLWHYFAAACSIVLVGVHLGLHWEMIRRAAGKRLPGRAVKALGVLVLVAALGWGSFSLATGSFARWITMPFSSAAPAHMMPGGEEMGMARLAEGGHEAGELPDAVSGATVEQHAEGGAGKKDYGEGRGFGKNGFGGKGEHRKEGMPGGFGAGMQGGMSAQPVSASNVLSVMATYGSEITVFAFLTALLDGLHRKRRQKLLPMGETR